ncbi:ABL054Cp [Eremothecium gossypii ATCC 10895]|uniref:Apurinic-apyrimidinic endonuclease 1 n=1 Tax=Eremothecium gossypii (strain ATCC 10895 / CBS 109.51 / FGSC 9923 / NRRL Y-1056) TaxID=284811 RepID=Q75DT0_EREGS|nr:ABL054Cp [Eremothecium gossypii ATCC 10895]AAS50717.1 ABL054Cp [Eremothecium gossypii ATCC 10895]AEY95006.1 FABL054Cp [Eremothecium gossypii FDAG1]
MGFVRCTASRYKFGAHVSGAGGISNSVVNAHRIGCNAFAMFLKSPKQWVSKAYSAEEIKRFHDNCEELGYNPRTDVLPHGLYFINLANPDREKAEKAYGAFLDDLQRCEQLGIGLYNFHPGSALKGEYDAQLRQLAMYINRAISETKFVKIVLENMAGHGNIIGSKLEDLRTVIDLVEQKDRVGVCVDTCHTFAAGYDIRSRAAFDSFWDKFRTTLGMQYLASMHINDSKAPLAANADRHELLGQGFLGLEAFRLIARSDFLQNIPIILETPQKEDDGYGEEIKMLEWLEGVDDEAALQQEYKDKCAELQQRGAKSRQEFAAKFEKKKAKAEKATGSRKRAAGQADIVSQMGRKAARKG